MTHPTATAAQAAEWLAPEMKAPAEGQAHSPALQQGRVKRG
eukprot:CAMPEP_0118981682 /NCGR_PEP_ID=MMETSP1173-20130426/31073_1 /TAXON_ID=1034831 /ORGANISM="Rhizochromulina marina cf, Strain CCMP1243" /LENGTH=40 /DNA_ID= /DNA_START= /DNA_END= /DNA_ORIENTATION=